MATWPTRSTWLSLGPAHRCFTNYTPASFRPRPVQRSEVWPQSQLSPKVRFRQAVLFITLKQHGSRNDGGVARPVDTANHCRNQHALRNDSAGTWTVCPGKADPAPVCDHDLHSMSDGKRVSAKRVSVSRNLAPISHSRPLKPMKPATSKNPTCKLARSATYPMTAGESTSPSA